MNRQEACGALAAVTLMVAASGAACGIVVGVVILRWLNRPRGCHPHRTR